MNFKSPTFNHKFQIVSLVLVFSALSAQKVYAETRTSVDVKTNTGNNTVCVNGKCETGSNGTSKSRVCVNGECYESDGDLKVESKNGKTKVDIKSKSSDSHSADEEKIEQEDEREEIEENEVKGASSQEEEDPGDEEDENKDKFSFVEFVEEQLSFLRKIITFQFLFGNK